MRTITRTLAAATAAAAIGAAGLTTAGPATAAGLPDVAVTPNRLPFGCQAVVTNVGTATARDVTVRGILASPPTQNLGDIAPGQTKTASYIDCAFYMFGLRVVATTSNGDSNPLNNFARIYP